MEGVPKIFTHFVVTKWSWFWHRQHYVYNSMQKCPQGDPLPKCGSAGEERKEILTVETIAKVRLALTRGWSVQRYAHSAWLCTRASASASSRSFNLSSTLPRTASEACVRNCCSSTSITEIFLLDSLVASTASPFLLMVSV